MNKQSVLIYKLPELFKILNEIREELDFNIYSFSKKDEIFDLKKKDLFSYVVLTNSENEIKEEKCQLVLKKLPDTINSIIEKINVSLLKQKYSEQSNILVGKYSIDTNSRSMKNANLKLKLTQREIQIILFLKQSKSPQNIENLQKEVWGHNSDLETHTVETHIYRLRKKISEKFEDSSFINSTKLGYKIK